MGMILSYVLYSGCAFCCMGGFLTLHFDNILFYYSGDLQGISKDQLRHTEGNVILHVTFAIKQDQEMGKEFVKYIKVLMETFPL